MRRWLSILLTLTLVLRGLLGDAMAMGIVPMAHGGHTEHAAAVADTTTAASPAAAHAAHSDHGQPVVADSGDAHHQHAVMAANHCGAANGDTSASCDGDHGPSCTLCGICHSAASAAPWGNRWSPGPVADHRASGRVAFISAPAAPTIKPPIA